MASGPLLSIVDDDEALLRSLANLIRSLGIRVEPFASAAAFLNSPEGHRTDCVLVDVRMPGMDGPGLVKALAGRGQRTPFIFMSAYTDAVTRPDVARLGAVAFLQKPCSETDLVAAIGTALATTALVSSTVEPDSGDSHMSTVTTTDGVQIFFKDWGPRNAQPIVFHHGWPLSADDWDGQMLYFLEKGFRVIAHDRRGHGRSSQVGDGHDMDHYAADIAAVVTHLDLRNAIHVGHSTGGGEATHYVARHGKGRVDKLVMIGAVPPIMLRTPANPGGLPIEVFDGFRRQLAANRAQFYRDVASGPFYGYNRPGAEVSDAVVENWWRQGMMGGAKAHYDGIKAFSETDFTEDLEIIDVPTLVMHGDDDQIVPFADSAPLSAKLLKKGTLKVYENLPHGLCTTHPDVVNRDLLAFIQS